MKTFKVILNYAPLFITCWFRLDLRCVLTVLFTTHGDAGTFIIQKILTVQSVEVTVDEVYSSFMNSIAVSRSETDCGSLKLPLKVCRERNGKKLISYFVIFKTKFS